LIELGLNCTLYQPATTTVAAKPARSTMAEQTGNKGNNGDKKQTSGGQNDTAGWPSKNDGKESGKGRDNNPPAKPNK
jgi:hypothetical protein